MWWPDVSAFALPAYYGNSIRQGQNPDAFLPFCGTAEVVPFHNATILSQQGSMSASACGC
jgi:hypothetical protein